MAKLSVQEIVEAIEQLTVLELSELVKALEEKFGVSAAPVAVAAPVAGGAAPAAEQEEKTSFDVVITDVGGQKVKVLKALREITGKSLQEVKAMIESTPSKVKEGISKEEAEEIKKKLEEAGAKVELK